MSGNNPSPSYAGVPASHAGSLERATFIKKTYLHLALAILALVAVESVLLGIPAVVSFAMSLTQGWTWLMVLGGFMFVTSLADNWARSSTKKSVQYGALAVYVVAEAFIFLPMLFVAQRMAGGNDLIMQAGIITMALFTGLSAVVFLTGKDFSFLRSALMIGGLVAIGLIVCSIAFGFSLGLVFSGAMVILAAMSILYTTSGIMNHYNTDQYVAASLSLFASFMLMMWYVLRIVMSMAASE